MYVSQLNSPIITEHVPIAHNGREHGRGYVPRLPSADPNNPAPYFKPFPKELYIPRAEWPERIKDLERNKATLVDVRERAGIETVTQNGFEFCWVFGTVNAIRVAIAAAGGGYRKLSATGAAAQCTKFQNRGGNTFEIIPWIAENGVPTIADWPLDRMDRSLVTDTMKAHSAETKIDLGYELPSNDFDAAGSCLLRGLPCPLGLAWWSHLINGLALRALDGTGRYGIEIENSWGEEFGNKGLAVLPEEKATAFDQAAIRVVTPKAA